MENRSNQKRDNSDSRESTRISSSEEKSSFNVIKGEIKRKKEERDIIVNALRERYSRLKPMEEKFVRQTKDALDALENLRDSEFEMSLTKDNIVQELMEKNKYIIGDDKFEEDKMKDLVSKLGFLNEEGKVDREKVIDLVNKSGGIEREFVDPDKMKEIEEFVGVKEIFNSKSEYDMILKVLELNMDEMINYLPEKQVSEELQKDYEKRKDDYDKYKSHLEVYRKEYRVHITHIDDYNKLFNMFKEHSGGEAFHFGKLESFFDIQERHSRERYGWYQTQEFGDRLKEAYDNLNSDGKKE